MLAVEAAIPGERGAALRALVANPLVGGLDARRPLLDALIEANLRYLPRFFDSGLADSEIGTAKQPRSGRGRRK